MDTRRIATGDQAASCYFRTSVEHPYRKALVQIIERCNLGCAHCFVSAGRYGDMMSPAQIRDRLIPQLAAARVTRVTLTGGEPFVHPDLLEITRALRNADTCPYLVFAARTPQSRHADSEFIVGNIWEHDDIAARLDDYRFHDRYRLGNNPTCGSCDLSPNRGKGCPAAVVAAGRRIGDLDHEYRGMAMACLVAADRYHHLATAIRPALTRGTVVICDRYVASSLVLQRLDDIPLETVWVINRLTDRPALPVILAGDPAASRAARRHRPRGPTATRHAVLTPLRPRTGVATMVCVTSWSVDISRDTKGDARMDRTWVTIGGLVTWLDTEAAAAGDTARLLRILKMYEETGEVCGALEDVTAPAPAHGSGHTWEDVQTEVCDVIVTGMVALATLTPVPAALVNERVRALTGQSAPAGGLWEAARLTAAAPDGHTDARAAVTAATFRLLRNAGSIAEAVHGVMATNPRKGTSHTWADVQNRLGDTLFRAMILLALLTPDAEKLFAARLASIAERSGVPAWT